MFIYTYSYLFSCQVVLSCKANREHMLTCRVVLHFGLPAFCMTPFTGPHGSVWDTVTRIYMVRSFDDVVYDGQAMTKALDAPWQYTAGIFAIKPFQCGERLQTSQSDVCRRQIATSNLTTKTNMYMHKWTFFGAVLSTSTHQTHRPGNKYINGKIRYDSHSLSSHKAICHSNPNYRKKKNSTYWFCLSCPVLSCPVLASPVLYRSVLFCSVLFCSVLFCSVLVWSVLFCSVLFCSVLFCSVLFCSVLFCSALFWSVLFCSVLFCSVLFCSVLFCSALFCSVLFCSVLFCSVLFSSSLLNYALLCSALFCCTLLCAALFCSALHWSLVGYVVTVISVFSFFIPLRHHLIPVLFC